MNHSFLYDPLGPVGRKRARWATVGVIALLLVGILIGVLRLDSNNQLEADRWAILADPSTGVPQTLGNALLATLKAAAIAMVFALIAGLVFAFGRLSRSRIINVVSGIIVEGFRGIPLLMLMLFLALGLPQLGVDLSLLTIVVIALVAYNGSVLCEIFRGGVLSLPKGQLEAAEAMGVSYGTAVRRILLPQAVPQMLPVIISQMVILLKDTSLGYIIGYAELLRNGRSVVEFYGNLYALPIYVAVALMYILVNVAISMIARAIARRTGTHSRASKTSPLMPGAVAPLKS